MKAILLFTFLFVIQIQSYATPARVILVRHAEKPEKKSDHLSDKGYKRAAALAHLFQKQPKLADYGLPVALFAASYRPGDTTQRSIETLMPLSKKIDVPIISKFDKDEIDALAEHILRTKRYNGKTVMISWTHSWLPELVEELGILNPPKWKDESYDRIWVIDYTEKYIYLYDLPQRLLPGDSQD